MIAVEHLLESGRRARVFTKSSVPTADLAAHLYWDDEDQERAPLLAEALRGRPVRATAHPTVSAPDVLQVYLRSADGGERLFACTVVSQARLRQMLDEAPFVVEGFTLQVAQVDHLSTEGVRTALQSWIERTFPELVLPAVALDLWTSPTHLSHDVLRILTELPVRSAATGEPEFAPDPFLTFPPYEDAA